MFNKKCCTVSKVKYITVTYSVLQVDQESNVWFYFPIYSENVDLNGCILEVIRENCGRQEAQLLTDVHNARLPKGCDKYSPKHNNKSPKYAQQARNQVGSLYASALHIVYTLIYYLYLCSVSWAYTGGSQILIIHHSMVKNDCVWMWTVGMMWQVLGRRSD